MPTELDIYLDARQAAGLLGLSINTLAKWRLSGVGPKYLKLGRRVAYRQSDIAAWLDGCEFGSTSEYPPKRP